tara:strand:+ start:719 stop:1336 length:618 start_codon:yes stop_codon:yes gene_type:complete
MSHSTWVGDYLLEPFRYVPIYVDFRPYIDYVHHMVMKRPGDNAARPTLFVIVKMSYHVRHPSHVEPTLEKVMQQLSKIDLAEAKTPEPKTVEKIRTVYPRIKSSKDAVVTHLMDNGMSFDFEGVGIPQLYRLAVKQLVIDVQNIFRKATTAEQDDAANWEKVWKVTDLLDRQRVPVTDFKRADTAMDKMSQEEREAIFAKYGLSK